MQYVSSMPGRDGAPEALEVCPVNGRGGGGMSSLARSAMASLNTSSTVPSPLIMNVDGSIPGVVVVPNAAASDQLLSQTAAEFYDNGSPNSTTHAPLYLNAGALIKGSIKDKVAEAKAVAKAAAQRTAAAAKLAAEKAAKQKAGKAAAEAAAHRHGRQLAARPPR